MQDKDSIRSSINKRMNVVHRCISTPNIVLRALSILSNTQDRSSDICSVVFARIERIVVTSRPWESAVL